MTGKFGSGRVCVEFANGSNGVPATTIHSKAECLIQLLGAFQDIADLDDIHQASERLDAVQAWIRREARAAAVDLAFDDEAGAELRVTQATA